MFGEDPHANSIVFEKAGLAGILRENCLRLAEDDLVSIIDVSDDRKVTYILHI
ncbi:Uncharacterised protein [Klebsiella pneumoniae]|uniref:Uncharacterized protein n=1 Tax=Klebsiella pneumoniae TaxID=573 RepID=A0A378BWD5_KLEPN|nr:Uncharacterised protein [Klebsiella pneumoniae]STU52931.1 Uncharacterised protein [Klebsiella pneumoniae]STV55496.1 Uncharacterised protein [Klebsiella pneumoniae]